MSSKIESYGPQAAVTPLRPRAGGATTASPAGPIGAVAPVDSVRLTDDAVMLAGLREQLAAAPVVDGNRVADTRLALAEGRYEIDPHRIADKLMRTEWELRR